MKKIILLGLMLTGCAGTQVKKQIAADLNGIVSQGQDCQTICDTLKEYIKTKLGQ